MAAAFGTSPWHFYWQEIFRAPTYFIGLIFIVTIIVLFLSKEGRKQVELWIIIPFILGHNFVEHKEIRFLFPMIFLLPSIFFFAYDSIFKKISIPYSKVKYFHIGVLIVFLSANGIGIGLMASKSAGNGNITNAKYLHDITQKNEQKIDVYHLSWASPFHPWENITDKFHTPQNLNDIKIDNLCSLDTLQLNKENLNFVILRKVDLNNKDCSLETENWKLEKVSTSIPEWMESIKEWYELEKSNESIFYLYQLHFKE